MSDIQIKSKINVPAIILPGGDVQTQINSKQASLVLTNTHIFVGNGSNLPVDVAVSGDLTLANTGAFTIANLAITNAKIANSSIDLTAKVTGVLPIANGGTGTTSIGNLTDVGTDGIVITGGTGAVIGSGTSIAQQVADSTHNGYLSSTDWNTFNGKQAAGSYITALTGDVTAAGPGSSAATIAANAVTNSKLAQMATVTIKGNNTGGTASASDLTVAQVNAILPVFTSTLNGLAPLSGGGSTNFLRADGTWASPPGATSGTVTSVSMVSANGLAGTVATATTTPAITLSTTITGVLKGNGTAISAATPGTDYSAGTSALATGILKSTTGTGALTIAVAGDFPTLNQNTTGSAATLTTARTINGTSFDGSANITVTAAAGTLTGTTLNSTVVTSSLTTVGTITSGTWTGTTIAIANGGTGQTTKAAAFDALQPMTTGGDIIYGGASGTGTRLANGTSGQFLKSNGGTAAPTWATPTVTFTAPTAQRFTSSSGNYTTPANVLYIKVTMVGGGGGGAGTASNTTGAGAGGATTFGSSLLTANGGAAGGGPGGSASFGAAVGGIAATGARGGQSQQLVSGTGGTGGSSPLGGAGPGGIGNSQVGFAAAVNSGSGGGGGGGTAVAASGEGGAAGGYVSATIVPTASQVFAYAVGGAGAGATGGTNTGGAGGSGIIVVEEYYQ